MWLKCPMSYMIDDLNYRWLTMVIDISDELHYWWLNIFMINNGQWWLMTQPVVNDNGYGQQLTAMVVGNCWWW